MCGYRRCKGKETCILSRIAILARYPKMSEILRAAEAGDLLEIKCLVQAGGDVNTRNIFNLSVLHYAAKSGSLEMAKYLVENGADVNCVTVKKKSVFHVAAESGSLEILKYLVEHGAKLNCKTRRNKSALHYAAKSGSFEMVKYLVEHGAKLNYQTKRKLKSALHYAVQSDSVKMVSYLVEHDADVYCQNNNSYTSLHYAAKLGSLNMVKCLVDHRASVHCKTFVGGTPLHYAVKYDALKVIKYLIKQGADVNCKTEKKRSSLHLAVMSGSLEVIKYLVKHGADVNSEDEWGESALHYAARSGSLEMVKYLVEHGANLNYKAVKYSSILHLVGESGYLDIAIYLIEHGADANCKTYQNDSVLHSAVRSGSLEMVKYILSCGVDVNSTREGNESVLHYAVLYGSLEMVKFLIEHGADINCKKENIGSALHIAAKSGNSLEMIKYLVEKGATLVTDEGHGDKTLLLWAICGGNDEIIEYLFRQEAFKGIHEQKFIGRTLLSLACEYGSVYLLQTLLNYNVDVRKEKKLLCGNREIADILNLELNKSIKYREKVQILKSLDDEMLKKIESSLKYFCPEQRFSLGEGSDGTAVFLGVMQDGSETAVKRMLIGHCEDPEEIERNLLSLINASKSPFIVNYRTFVKDAIFLYLIVDLCEETLYEHVHTHTIRYLKKHGPRMIKEILCGLRFLHAQGILHRNLKPSNVLVDVDGHMRLADFGISRVLNNEETTVDTEGEGARCWMFANVNEAGNAGEIGRKSDIQAAGMIAFFILSKGRHPFGLEHEREENIVKGKPVNLHILEDLEARDFISWLIHQNIDNRPSVDQALKHPFMARVEEYKGISKPSIINLR